MLQNVSKIGARMGAKGIQMSSKLGLFRMFVQDGLQEGQVGQFRLILGQF